MRIAIVAPDASLDRAPRSAALADLLRSRGHEVTVVAYGSDAAADLRLGELAERSDSFDLVHVMAGARALTRVGVMRTALVATVDQEPGAGPIWSHYDGRVAFVADSKSETSGLHLEAFIPWSDAQAADFATAHEQVYERVVARAARVDRRPWGYYVVLADEPAHKIKRIVVYPGKRLSLQRHRQRSEHWYVIEGEALVTRDEEVIRVAAGHAIDIPIGAWHRIQNPANTDMAFVEVQTGTYFGEDDIERQEDDFGRA